MLTAVLSLLWSHNKFVWQDEVYVLQTDSVPSVAQLVHIQLTSPIALDPLAYHLAVHAAVRLFGAGPFALRVPSLLGYLLMQVCLFLFVRRIAGERAGLLAAAIPALAVTLGYSAEGRPYGLLLGFFALTLLSWQSATRATSQRMPALLTLAAAIALALNTHYFGVLLLVPLCAAELVRSIERRRFDLPVIAAILAGMAGIAATLPFQKAAAAYRTHYYNVGVMRPGVIGDAYRSLFLDDRHSVRSSRLALLLIAAALIVTMVGVWRSRSRTLPTGEAVFIVALAMLPFFAYGLAYFVTHAMEARFVLGTLIGVSSLYALWAAPMLRDDAVYRVVAFFVFGVILLVGGVRIRSVAREKRDVLAASVPSAALKAAILASPDHLLYFQNFGRFEVASTYDSDPYVREHTALVYSPEQEMTWHRHDTDSLSEYNLRQFSDIRLVPYASVAAQPGPHIFVVYRSEWDWTDQAFAQSHAEVTAIGPAFDGTAVSVRFPPPAPATR